MAYFANTVENIYSGIYSSTGRKLKIELANFGRKFKLPSEISKKVWLINLPGICGDCSFRNSLTIKSVETS